jgi:hypothetical protein
MRYLLWARVLMMASLSTTIALLVWAAWTDRDGD